MSLSNVTMTLPSLPAPPIRHTLSLSDMCALPVCLFISDHTRDLCFASKFSHAVHKNWIQDFSISTSIKESLHCARNVLLLWFALLLFVNPRKWTFPLSSCAGLNVHIWSACVCMTDGERAAKETHKSRVEDRHADRGILKYRKERPLSHWWIAPSWKLKHLDQMVDRHGNRTLVIKRMTNINFLNKWNFFCWVFLRRNEHLGWLLIAVRIKREIQQM